MSNAKVVLVIGGDEVIDEVLTQLDFVSVWDDGDAALWVPPQMGHHKAWDQLPLLETWLQDNPTAEGGWHA